MSINRNFGIGIESNAVISTQKPLDSYAATMVTPLSPGSSRLDLVIVMRVKTTVAVHAYGSSLNHMALRRIKHIGVISRQKMYDSDRIFYNDGTTLVTDMQLFGRMSYGMAMGRNGKLAFELGYGRLTNRFFDGMVIGKDSTFRVQH